MLVPSDKKDLNDNYIPNAFLMTTAIDSPVTPSDNSKNPINDSFTLSFATYHTDTDSCSWLVLSVHSSQITDYSAYFILYFVQYKGLTNL